MKMKSLLGVISMLSVVAFTCAVGCGGDSSDKGASSSGGVVSCDIQQSGLHYCEEAPGSPGTNTGCPTMMTGFVPGTGCSRTGVSGTCTEGVYKFFLYTAGVPSSALANICPNGTFEPATLGGGVGGGSAGATSGGASGSGGECTIDPGPLAFGVTEINADTSNYVKGIAVEAVSCGNVPANEETTGADVGFLHPPHPTVPFYYKLTKAGYTPSLTMDATVAAGRSGIFQKHVFLSPTSTTADFFPGYTGTTASLIVHFVTNNVSCFNGGWTVAITGHPEAQVSYYTKPPYNGGTPTLSAAPASTALFYIAVTKLKPGAPAMMPLVVSGATGGTCSLQLNGSVASEASVYVDGKIPLEAGAITNAAAASN